MMLSEGFSRCVYEWAVTAQSTLRLEVAKGLDYSAFTMSPPQTLVPPPLPPLPTLVTPFPLPPASPTTHTCSAKVLAKKMIAIMELSQQQLSKQDHYDYGLRSFVIPIARAAGSLKRVEPDASEEVILYR